MGFSFFFPTTFISEIYESMIWQEWAGLIAVLFGVCLPAGYCDQWMDFGFYF